MFPIGLNSPTGGQQAGPVMVVGAHSKGRTKVETDFTFFHPSFSQSSSRHFLTRPAQIRTLPPSFNPAVVSAAVLVTLFIL